MVWVGKDLTDHLFPTPPAMGVITLNSSEGAFCSCLPALTVHEHLTTCRSENPALKICEPAVVFRMSATEGAISEWQKQHKTLGRALQLILPFYYLVYLTDRP